MALYLNCATGFAGRSIDKLTELRRFRRSLGLAFVIFGDAIVSTPDICMAGWLGELGAILRRAPLEVTRSTGGGFLIDSYLVKKDLSPAAQVPQPDLGASWRPHIGRRLKLDKAPRKHQHPVSVVPKAPPAPKDVEGLETEEERFLEWAMASSAGDYEESEESGSGHCHAIDNSKVAQWRGHASRVVGGQYPRFPRKVGRFWMKDRPEEEVRKALGRGSMPGFARTAVLPKSDALAKQASRYADPKDQWWATAGARLQELSKLVDRQRGFRQQQAILVCARTAIANSMRGMRGEEVTDCFLDGSGGKHMKYPRKRRRGYAAVGSRSECTTPLIRAAFGGSLPGRHQTVPRAERPAPFLVVEEVEGNLRIRSDGKYVVKGAGKRPGCNIMGSSGDSWLRYGAARADRAG